MLNEIFMTIPDHRVTGRCTYLLSDLLTIALLTYICDGEVENPGGGDHVTRVRLTPWPFLGLTIDN